jgi:cytochrome P450
MAIDTPIEDGSYEETPDFFADGDFADLASADDPRALARAMRAEPVMRVGEDFTIITRRENIETALRAPAVFSSGAEAVQLGNVRPLIPLQIDPPKHVKYRRILDPLFAPRAMGQLEGEVADLFNRFVDEFAKRGSCDLHTELAVPFPCTVFLQMMGLPLEDLDQFLAMKDGIIRPPGATFEDQEPGRKKAAQDIYRYFQAVIDKRRGEEAKGDLLGRIMASELDGVKLTDEEILDVCFLFIIAGLDTVTDSLDCMFAYLAQNSEHRQMIVENPAVISSAIEELLRWETPVPAVARVATEDVEVSGCPIHAGEQVMLLLASANTDDSAHPGVDSVDLERDPNPHLAFGGGVHRCLGSHLARLELRVALREFHVRIPNYSLADGTVLEYTPGLRSLDTLPIVFDQA